MHGVYNDRYANQGLMVVSSLLFGTSLIVTIYNISFLLTSLRSSLSALV
jgi:hypothetical protein